MRDFLRDLSTKRSLCMLSVALIVFAGLTIAWIGCSGSGSLTSNIGMGTISVSITDPPSCAFPNGSFEHVFVTIRSVQAHTSATADDNTPGWVELAPQLNANPMQIDLFALGPNACLLAMLGTNTPIPAGTYQQFRLLLVANDASSNTLSTNSCGSAGFNCVVLHDGSVDELELSSQVNTGLKIPPGQVVGGPVTVSPGQDVDLNIDFNACESIIQEGNGQFRLKPVLTAGQVSTNRTGISGQVVDAGTGSPISGGTVLVALEEPVGTGADFIMEQTAADSSGNFTFCPLPANGTFDVVAVAINGTGLVYNATAAIGVPGGTNLGAIPLTAETGAGPTTFSGFVTATTGTSPATIDAAVSALQSVPVGGGATRLVVIPAEAGSTASLTVSSVSSCPLGAPADANCGAYALVEPASNPRVGIFSSGKISFAAPASGDVLYSVSANALLPLGGGATDCLPPTLTTSLDGSGNPLKAIPSTTVTVKEIDFTGCT